MIRINVPLSFEAQEADLEFWEAVADAFKNVSKLIDLRREVGRDSVLPMMRKFPHGSQDLTFMMHAKVNRILGLEKLLKNGAPVEVEALWYKLIEEEALDLISWTAFFVAFMQCKKRQL
jgi:hypothetical protein